MVSKRVLIVFGSAPCCERVKADHMHNVNIPGVIMEIYVQGVQDLAILSLSVFTKSTISGAVEAFGNLNKHLN